MPIRKEMWPLYPGGSPRSQAWKAVVAEVRERAGERCERCKVPDRAIVFRMTIGGHYMLPDGKLHDAETGELMGMVRGSEMPAGRYLQIVCTTAHLDQDPANNGEPGDRPNLAYLCQRCHLGHDRPHHQRQRRRTLRGRKALGELFAET
jgi:hypothetical protein